MSDTTQLKFRGTQGEWKYLVTKKRQIAVIIPEKYGERVIDKKVYLGVIGEDDCPNPKCCNIQAHADAHLIAAAPQLIEACQKTLDTLIQVKKRYEKTLTDAAYSAISHRINDLTAAINKALNYE